MTATLLVIDLQRAIDDPVWAADGPRNNPGAERCIAALIAAWRQAKAPLIHIRHDSVHPESSYHPSGPGHAFKAEAVPLDGEPVFGKTTPSAFVGTPLDRWLRVLGEDLVICGVITNNSVEATVRHAACLGYRVQLPADACFTFAKRDWAGQLRSADEVHNLSLANLSGQYATITGTAALLSRT